MVLPVYIVKPLVVVVVVVVVLNNDVVTLKP